MKEGELILVVAVIPASEREQVNMSEGAFHVCQEVSQDQLAGEFPIYIPHLWEAVKDALKNGPPK